MLNNITHWRRGIFDVTYFYQREYQYPCSSGFRYTKMSFQTIRKLGGDVVIKENLENVPVTSSYEVAMEALSSLINRQKRGDKSAVGGKYGKLDRMMMYIKILGLDDHLDGLNIIHVAGTKGKGSACTFCEAMLRECGFRTGLFTSPHLIDVRERFRLDGLDISEDKFLKYFWECWKQLKESITEDLPMPPLFQFLAVLAFKIFVCEKVDVAIIEAGLGGKKDSTNVIKKPVVCGITSLGMDHMESLGDTLGKIASHKAGIIKPEVPAFTTHQLLEAMDVLQGRARELMVPLKVVAPLDHEKLDGLKLGLSGDHQFVNAGLAVSLCKSWLRRTGNWEKLFQNDGLEDKLPVAFLRGLSRAHLSGRAQIFHDPSGDLTFYLDGAHSPESMEVCARWFSSVIQSKENSSSSEILLFNCMEVRDPQILIPHLVSTCASSGIHITKAIFVPSMSAYNKVTSGAFIAPDIPAKDLSWQYNLQRIWENTIHGKDILQNCLKMEGAHNLPPFEFILKDMSQCNPADGYLACSAVFPSLPLTINWLRDCVRKNPSIKIEVLVTGSIHLVGDVLKIIKR
ncbi:Tetrahydrofolate synthase [Bertholletia excelsa]